MKTLSSRLAQGLVGLLLSAGGCKTGTGETVVPSLPSPAPSPTPTAPTVVDPPARTWPGPPPPIAPKPVNFPEVGSFRLANGLDVYVIENHEVPIVTAELAVRAGTMDDELLAGFTARMLSEGTHSRSKAEIDEAIESVGGFLSANAGTHVSTVFSHSLSGDLALAMRLMADEVQNPALSALSLDKLAQESKAALLNRRAQPDELADALFYSVMYPPGHPYGRPMPTAAQIDAITLADVRRFHSTFYRADNAFLLLSGDITLAVAKPLAERAFGTWATSEPEALPPNPLNRFTRYVLPGELAVHLVDRPQATQATIRVGNLALARNHEDWAALYIANGILGGGPNARLFRDLREDRSLTYGIYSELTDGQAPGAFVIETETRTPTTGAMLAGIFDHITRMRTEDPPRAEFETAVRERVGSFPLQVETPDQIVAKVLDQLVYGLPPDYWKTYRDTLTRVELPEIRKAALRYIHALPVVVVVGNAAEIRPQLEAVLPTARIVEYDAELQRMP